MKAIFGLTYLLFGLSTICLATKVEEKTAAKAGLHFYYERVNQFRPVPLSSLFISESFAFPGKDEPLYYIFNIGEEGFIIVSADDAVKPILAYSFEGKYDPSDIAPQFKAWMNQYAGQIRYVILNSSTANPETASDWTRLTAADSSRLVVTRSRNVAPLLTSKWNQNSPYNSECPSDLMGPGGHAYAGCVPVCMAQIMYYYRWPDKGTGSYTYMDSTYGIQHVCFDSTWYLWDNMKNSITKANHGIAQLLYHLGVSCDLVYGPNGSGMRNHKAAYSLRTFFKYSPGTQYVFRDSTSLDWDSTIMAHLDRKMPLYYAGWSVPNINGHAFVCDGYQGGDYYHFNFGWSGSNDGYFYLDNLVPGGNNFNLAQELVINIYPDTLNYSYPRQCTGTSTLKFTEGSVTDGSGPMVNYLSSANCQWLIDPQTDEDTVTSVSLTFDHLDLAAGDTLTLYDGSSLSAPVLGKFSGSTLPGQVTSSGNKILIRFLAAGGNTAPGWETTYTSISPVMCSGITIIKGDTADFSDGSLRFNYHNNSNCKWKLLATDTLPLTIHFRSFDTEPELDVLKIYDLDSQSLIATISGHYNSFDLPDSVTAPKGKMMLLFTSNSSVTGDGFEIYYPGKSTNGLKDPTLTQLKIFPNPTSEKVNISFFNTNLQWASFDMISAMGKPVFSERRNLPAGFVRETIPVNTFTPGLYLLKITTDNQTVTRKLLVN